MQAVPRALPALAVQRAALVFRKGMEKRGLRGCTTNACFSDSFLKRKTVGHGAHTAGPVGPRFRRAACRVQGLPGGLGPSSRSRVLTCTCPASPSAGVSPLRVWAHYPRRSTLGTLHSARAQITLETEATEETRGEFKYWSSKENLKGSCACFEDIKKEFALVAHKTIPGSEQ